MLTVDVIGRVETSDGMAWDSVRVMVDHAGKAGVWSGFQTVAWASAAAAVESSGPHGPWRITATGGGTVLTVTRTGCGCGSPLRALGEMDLAALAVPAVPA